MEEPDVLEGAFAMPLTNPADPSGPYRFINRECMTIKYRMGAEKLHTIVPAPLEVDGPQVKCEFMSRRDQEASEGFRQHLKDIEAAGEV
jgi:acetoacetate decarboxylase